MADLTKQGVFDKQAEIIKNWEELCDLILAIDAEYSVLPLGKAEKLREVRLRKDQPLEDATAN